MKVRSRLISLSLVTLLFPLLAGAAVKEGAAEPVAHVTRGAAAIAFQPTVDHERILLTISTPNGEVMTREFVAGKNPSFSLQDLAKGTAVDGSYTFELRVVPRISSDVRQKLAEARSADDDAAVERIQREAGIGATLVQSGTFGVKNGAMLGDADEPPAAGGGAPLKKTASSVTSNSSTPVLKPTPNDQVIADDLIVQGSACVGLDCVNNESFGFDTIRLKENNTRLKFDDTSTSSGFPFNDWQLTANDSNSGGANKFSIDDITNSKTPFTVTANAPTNSIFVDSSGRLGLRTSTPGLDINIKTGNTPATRYEQDTSGGFSAQTWDIGANEANFFIRDVTSGSKLPFRIRPGAPTSSIDISASGNVGIGTASPSGKLHALTTTNGPFILTTDGKVGIGTASPSDFLQVATAGGATINAVNNVRLVGSTSTTWSGFHLTDNATADGFIGFLSGGTPLLGFSNGSATAQLVITSAGNVGVGVTNPTNPIQAASGALLTAGGVWTNASSRAFKQDIKDLDSKEAMDALRALDPVKYAYKVDPSEHHVGFIAEDVPALVATKDRKSLSPMDVVAVLTKVVQDQQKTIDELKARLDQLEQQH